MVEIIWGQILAALFAGDDSSPLTSIGGEILYARDVEANNAHAVSMNANGTRLRQNLESFGNFENGPLR